MYVEQKMMQPMVRSTTDLVYGNLVKDMKRSLTHKWLSLLPYCNLIGYNIFVTCLLSCGSSYVMIIQPNSRVLK